MIIFKDIITDDEIISDSFPMQEVDGVVYECNCSMITLGNVQVDTGANASAEEASENLDDTTETVNDIVSTFRYSPTNFDKKSYVYHLKKYMKTVKRKMEERGASKETIANFETKAQAYAKKIIEKFNDYEFYVGESMDPDGMIILLNYREDQTTPYITIWKDGLTSYKS